MGHCMMNKILKSTGIGFLMGAIIGAGITISYFIFAFFNQFIRSIMGSDFWFWFK